MSHLKLLVIHEVNYLRKPLYEIHDFPEYVSRLGWDVAFYQFPEGESQKSIITLSSQPYVVSRTASNSPVRLITPRSLAGNVVGRLAEALFSVWRIPKLISAERPDLILLYAVPTYGWQAVIAGKRATIPTIYRALDSSSQIRRSVFSSLVRLAEQFVVRHATHVSANNAAMLDYCVKLGLDPGNGSIEYPPVGLETVDSAIDVDLAPLVEQKKKNALITYMGSFFYFSGLPQVVSRFAELNPSGVKLLLIGGGEQEGLLKSLVAKLGLEDRVIFTGFVHRGSLPKLLELSTVLINPMEIHPLSNVALPQKVIQYLATSNPVVSTRLEGLLDAVGDFPNLFFEDSPEAVLDRALKVCTAHERVDSTDNSEKLNSRFGIRALETFQERLVAVKKKFG